MLLALALILAPIIAAGTNGLDPQTDAQRWSADDALQIRQLYWRVSAIGAEPSGATQCALRDLQLVTRSRRMAKPKTSPPRGSERPSLRSSRRARPCGGTHRRALAIYDSIVVAPAEMEKGIVRFAAAVVADTRACRCDRPLSREPRLRAAADPAERRHAVVMTGHHRDGAAPASGLSCASTIPLLRIGRTA